MLQCSIIRTLTARSTAEKPNAAPSWANLKATRKRARVCSGELNANADANDADARGDR